MVTVTKSKTWTYRLNQALRLMGRVFPEDTEFVEISTLSDDNNVTFRVYDNFEFTVPRNGKVHTTIHRSSLVIN